MLSASYSHESSPQAYMVRTVGSTPGITGDGQILSPLANVLQVWMAELDASPAWVTRSPQSFHATPWSFLLPASKGTTRSPSSFEVTCGHLPRCTCFDNVHLILDLGLDVPASLHHVSWSQLDAAQTTGGSNKKIYKCSVFCQIINKTHYSLPWVLFSPLPESPFLSLFSQRMISLLLGSLEFLLRPLWTSLISSSDSVIIDSFILCHSQRVKISSLSKRILWTQLSFLLKTTTHSLTVFILFFLWVFLPYQENMMHSDRKQNFFYPHDSFLLLFLPPNFSLTRFFTHPEEGSDMGFRKHYYKQK